MNRRRRELAANAGAMAVPYALETATLRLDSDPGVELGRKVTHMNMERARALATSTQFARFTTEE